MPKRKLNDRLIRSLSTEKVQEDFWDTSTSGLGLRVSSKGIKTFFCRYSVGRKQRRFNLGRYPGTSLSEARIAFRKLQNEVIQGVDPQAEKEVSRTAKTVSELLEIYCKDKSKKLAPRTIYDYRGIFRRELEKPIGSIRARDLRKSDVVPVLRKLGEKYPTQCQHAQAILRAILNYGVQLDILPHNPIQQLPPFGKIGMGERVFSGNEIRAYLNATKSLPMVESSYFQLLLLYGVRPGELAKWRWDWIESDRITIPKEYQKNRKQLILPLIPFSSKLIFELRQITRPTGWLFPSPDKTNHRKSFKKFRWKIADIMSEELGEVEDWNLRDIRRTTETHLRELGVNSDTVANLLNHNTSLLQRTYDKSINLAAKKEALASYEIFLKGLRSVEKNEITTFEQGIP